MISKLKTGIKTLIYKIPGKKYIVFESKPDFSDNTRAVYDEMLRRDLDKKYHLCWWVSEPGASMPDQLEADYLHNCSFLGLQKYRWATLRAKALICCNRFIEEAHPHQKAFYLTHGTALKGLGDYGVPEGISYMTVASRHVVPTMARDFHMHPEQVFGLGYPRNDVLTQPGRDLHGILPGDFRKAVVWYPTFRQHKNGQKTGTGNSLPVLHDAAAAVKLNEIARECGILIVVKPHFAQDLSYIKEYDLSNILFIDDSFFVKNKISSYGFVGSCDAMITDYSSIYFDYLLCDKPVAVIWEDIEDYRKNPGFSMDPDEYMRGSHKIYNLEDYIRFLRALAAEEDPYRQERNALNELMNFSCDGKNAQRVTDFIIEKANL